MPVITQNPFARPGRWLRGNLHMHTTQSDGARSPVEAVAWYRAQGYDFVSVTDHITLTETSHLQTPDFLTLSGVEYHGDDLDLGHYHVVAIGMAAEPPPFAPAAPLQRVIDAFRTRGAFVSIAHPYWCGQSARDLLAVNNYHAIEVFNATCRALNDKGFSSAHWDGLLAAGRRVWGQAVDDTHWLPERPDAGQGWIWVKAAALTAADILGALQHGQFYATTGPTIEDLVIEGKRAWVRCSPCAQITFIGDRWHGRPFYATPGTTLTEAEYRLNGAQRYLRVECSDGRGGRAWSPPFFLDGTGDV